MITLKIGFKWSLLDTKLAIKRARRLKIARNWFQVRHICSVVVLILSQSLPPAQSKTLRKALSQLGTVQCQINNHPDLL